MIISLASKTTLDRHAHVYFKKCNQVLYSTKHSSFPCFLDASKALDPIIKPLEAF